MDPLTAFARREMNSITAIKSDEGGSMKTAIIIIIVIISVALLVTGILYGNHPHTDHVKAVTLQEAPTTQIPEQTSVIIIEPTSSFPVY
jgi:flagellar basal body-associated protein FliL